ncbi:MAG: hypothetical protein QNK37_36955 [Acidobacteriota bacterium]|nr:hypothetical protein [Acidobacteriota bacterium]
MKKIILSLIALSFFMPAMAQQEAGDSTYGFFVTVLKPDGGDESGFFNIDYGRFLTRNSQYTFSVSGPISSDFPDFSYVRGGYEWASAAKMSWFFGAGLGYFNLPSEFDGEEFQVDVSLGVRLFSTRNLATEFKYQYQSPTDGFGDEGIHALLAGIKVFKPKK